VAQQGTLWECVKSETEYQINTCVDWNGDTCSCLARLC